MHSIIIVGDLFPVSSNYSRFSEGDISYLFGNEICGLFSNADYRICNLEGALTDRPGKCEKTGPYVYAPKSVVKGFLELGINCCALANNHITDAGDQGVIDTIDTLDKVGIKHIGAGKNSDAICRFVTFNVGDRCIGLYNVAETMYNEPARDKPGAFLYDELIVSRELELHKTQCDFLIVIYHGGAEKYRYPSPQTRKRFHRMVDSGANMILSQHTHCVGSEEYYKGAYLLYGQGNFLFRSFNNEFTDTGLIIELELSENGYTVKKHLVNAVDDMVRYDDKQDFCSFNERSARISDEKFLAEQFGTYCLNELPIYLKAYKGKYAGYRIIRRFFPKLYTHIAKKCYERNQLLFMLHSLRSEQNREIVMEGLKQYLGFFE